MMMWRFITMLGFSLMANDIYPCRCWRGSQQVAIWIGPAQEADSYKVGDFLVELGVGS